MLPSEDIQRGSPSFHGTILLGALCLLIGARLWAWGGSGGPLAGLLQRGTDGTSLSLSAVGWDLVQKHADCVATRGAWLDRSPVPQVLVQHLHNPAHACAADKGAAEAQAWVYDRDPGLFFAYAGHPAECPLPSALDRARFCRALRGRPLLLVGDSTTFTTHDVLLGALLDAPYPAGAAALGHSQFDSCPADSGGHAICGLEAEATEDLPAGHPSKVLPSSLLFVRNDYLRLNVAQEREGPQSGWGPGGLLYPWVHLLQSNAVLLLNRGAHFVETETVLRDLEETLAYVRERAPGALVVFRNTVGGVENITAERLPLATRRAYASGGFAEAYAWDHFADQNLAVRELFNSLREPGGESGLIYLDVDSSTALRPDRHIDYLHCCIPGPQDHWVLLLQEILEKASEVFE